MRSASSSSRITFISAGAGSGKTHRLTEILHRELVSGNVRPSGVIATTFTKKAATELRERVREHLLGLGRFREANAMGQAHIGTVNSVCGRLIERFAFEAGIATEQQVLEESHAALMLNRAIDDVLDREGMTAFLAIARRMGLEEDWTDTLQALVNLIRSNDLSLEVLPEFAARNAKELLTHFPKPVAINLDDTLLQIIDGVLPQLEKAAEASGKQNTQNYLQLVRDMRRMLLARSAAWSDWVKLSKAKPEAALQKLVVDIGETAAQFPQHAQLHSDIRDFLCQIFSLAGRVLEVYGAAKREQGVLDFADQEHLLLRLLEHPSVAETLRDELDLLMVDEFQDTSPIQLALFLKLAEFAKRVYWVGDTKQAIYGFRGSDTALMQSLIERLPALGGAKEVLTDSWRSLPQLVEIVNAIFVEAFRETLNPAEVRLSPKRTEFSPAPALANWILGGKNSGSEVASLAAGVRRLITGGFEVVDRNTKAPRQVRLGDVAILARSHAKVATVATALRAQGVACATAQPGLLSTPEATLAVACLRRLNDPGDTIASAEILSLHDGMEPEIWLADRLRHLSQGGDPNGWQESGAEGRAPHALLNLLAELRSRMPLLSPSEAVRDVIATCHLAKAVVRWSGDPDKARLRLANLDSLLALADEYEKLCASAQQAASISGLLIWLQELADDELDVIAEPALDAVKVLTHHAAKGLEWPVVILMDLGTEPRSRLWGVSAQSDTEFDANAPLADRFIRYWPWAFGLQRKFDLADSIDLSPVADQFRKAALEEEKRLLYVSMTRARDLLVLARSNRNPQGAWIDSIGADWLLTKEDGQEITLPSGKKLAATLWELDPIEAVPDKEDVPDKPLYWLEPDSIQKRSSRLPLVVNPSASQSVQASVLEKCKVGERIIVAREADTTDLGTAIHACLALALASPDGCVASVDFERILAAHQVHDSVSAEKVADQIRVIKGWIQDRWPDAKCHTETPVQARLVSGQILVGRLDLLLEVQAAWILIDHKSTQLSVDYWDRVANEHSAQLFAYADAVWTATGRKVIESWLLLPVAAGAIRIGAKPAVDSESEHE